MSLLNQDKPVKQSPEAKFAQTVLNFIQLSAYILGLFAFIELLRSILGKAGLSTELIGVVAWAAAIGIVVVVGWALQARNR